MTTKQDINLYQNIDLELPEKHRADITAFVRNHPESGNSATPFKSPFYRIVDVWFLAVCVGSYFEQKDENSTIKRWGFMTGTVLSADPWRIQLLELLAISESDTPYDIFKSEGSNAKLPPIRLANSYAAVGIDYVLDYLKGNQQPIENLGEALRDIVDSPK